MGIASYIQLFLGLIIFIILIWLFDFIFDVRKNIATQKLYDQRSWVWYMHWVVATAFVWAPSIFFLVFDFHIKTLWISSVLLFISGQIFEYWYQKIDRAKLEDLLPMRFAAGAVGKSQDAFDFKDSAESVAKRLLNIKNHISVVGIYGFPGFGKSSFSRMIIESLPRDKTLYTYISLTETNEAKDFSKLFAERWFASLKERYPKIDTKLAVPFMQSILRESGNGIIASLFELIPGINKGLKSTKTKVFDPTYVPSNAVTYDEIANVFGNVPEIHEQLWVVVIDEIERARFDEVYRVIEIIERYKNEGRTGMPIRVMFMLCVSDGELRKYLQKYDSNELSYLISNFFFGGSKSLTIGPIFLPPVSYDNKVKYFKDKILAFDAMLEPDQKTPKLKEDLGDVYFDTISHATRFEVDETKRLSQAFGLIRFSPRLIDRCIEGLHFTFGAYRKESYISRPTGRMSDLLVMEYIRIEYPYIMSFLGEYAEAMKEQFDNNVGMTPLGLTTYLEKKGYGDGKNRFADLIAKVLGKQDMTDTEKKDAENLVAFVCHLVFDFWDQKYEVSVSTKIEYIGTLSDPYNLWNYLRMTNNGKESPYTKLDGLYSKHKNGQLDVANLSLQDLHDYARFLIDAGDTPINMHLDVLDEVASRLTLRKVEIKLRDVGDTTYDMIVFDFSYILLTIVEWTKNNAGIASSESVIRLSSIMKNGLKALESVLRSPKVTTGAKFIILNSFSNDTRGSGSSIHSRFASAFAYMLDYDKKTINELIQYTFDEYEKGYYVEKKSIYENEENFFYVMYQGWSGKKDNTYEIMNIREVAERNLTEHVDALDLYWNRYSIKQATRREVLKSAFDDIDPNALFMPLATLIKITETTKDVSEEVKKKMEFWRPALNDPVYLRREELSNKNDTLRSVLIEKGLLRKKEPPATK